MALPTVPAPTSGVGVPAMVTVDAQNVSLSMSGTHTHQITAAVKDLAGTGQTAASAFSYISLNPSVATVNASGMITGVKQGDCVIEVSYPLANNTKGVHPTTGAYIEKIYAEINVRITK